MKQLTPKKSNTAPSILSVSYKSPANKDENVRPMEEAVIITDALFVIRGLNETAETIYKIPTAEAAGKRLFDLIRFEMVGISLDTAIKNLYKNGFWQGDILYDHNGRKILFNTRCSLVKDETGTASSIVIVTSNISGRLKQQKALKLAEYKYQTLVESLSEGVMLINADGTIGATNKKAVEMFGFTEDNGEGRRVVSPDWKIIKEDGSEFPVADYPAIRTLSNGSANNNIVMGLEHINGKKIWVSVNSHPIFEEQSSLPVAAVVSIVEITEMKRVNEQLSQSELLFRTFMKNSPTLGWIYDEEGMLVYGNPRFFDIMGLPEDAGLNNIAEFTNWVEMRTTILERNKEVILHGKPFITEDEFADKDGNTRNFLSYWFLLPLSSPRKLIGGHAVEITESKKAYKELDKMYERYTFAINASSDAIWDLDVSTGAIFRSDTFSTFSGYVAEDISPTLDWFLEKIHPLDRKRIRTNVNYCLSNNVKHWENEYRFKIADGSYRHLLDRAHALYKDARLVRVIGAMQDITERKELEAQLLNEQVQKQKLVNKAIIHAQEKERDRISGELHDNVNQLLMSAKLHVCVARTRAEGETELLDKANEYLLMAVAEIRSLSKSLNSAVMTGVGLLKSIDDIAGNMRLLKNINLQHHISEEVVSRMSNDQQMMVYRIIQEQSSNILKYSETREAMISMKIVNNDFELVISDNGKGFDKNETRANGIGLINIFNRVDAYNGKVDIITSPGNGCTVLVNFPVTEVKSLT